MSMRTTARRWVAGLVVAVGATSSCHRTPAAWGGDPVAAQRGVVRAVTVALTGDDPVAAPVVLAQLHGDSSITADDVRRAFGNQPGGGVPRSALVSAFIAAQRGRGPAPLLDSVAPRWRVVPVRDVDSLRAATRQPRLGGETVDRSAIAFWEAWGRQHPGSGGYHLVSVPGLSADGREALLQVTHRCGAVCGSAWYLHLRRDRDGMWRVLTRVQRSVS